MAEDPIVREVREHRQQRAQRLGYNIRAIAEDARKREQEGGRKVVSYVKPR